MSRKSRPPTPTTRAREPAAWQEALRRRHFVYGDISFALSISLPQAMALVGEWEADGKVARIAAPPGYRRNKLVFEVVEQGEIALPLGGDLYHQMWTVMRKLSAFTAIDLVAHVAVEIARDQASAYCQLLLKAGYLKVLAQGVPGKKEAIYKLDQKTGVEAPRERRLRCVVDPNTGVILPLAEGLL